MTYEEIDELQHKAYEDGYADGVRDFAKRIREQRDRTWSISEIEKDLLGEKIYQKKLSIPVKGISLYGTNQIRFNSMQEAQRNGFSCAKISLCVNGKRKSHKGYIWERDENYGN